MGDIRALMLLPTTKASVHAASGIVSTGPGHLFGFLVVSPGSTGTMVVYNNASAASGNVLRTVASAELVQGAFIWCGPDGLDASAGIYVALGGGTAPIVLAIFEGTYPVISFTGTERWFDGANGSDSNDGLTINTPRLSINGLHSADYNTGNHRWYFKRGTEIQQHRGSGGSSITMVGTNIKMSDYGDASAAKPIIWEDASELSINFETTATTGNVRIENLRFEYREAAKKSGTFYACAKGCQVEFNNCESDNYTNGFQFSGGYSRVVDCVAETCSQGVLVGTTGGTAPPNYGLLLRCVSLEPSADAWSIHDGTGTGLGTCVIACNGNAGTESIFDIQGVYDSGLSAYNIGAGGTSTSANYVVTDDGADSWSFVGNQFTITTGNILTMLLRGASPVVVGNYVYGNATNGGASVLGMKSTATGCVIRHNVFEAGSAAASAISFRQDSIAGSSGTFENNIIISTATSGGRAILFINGTNYDAWTLNNNCYYTPNGAKYHDGTADHSNYASYIDAAQADAHESGTVNQNPALAADYQLPSGSALVGAGATPTVMYLGRYGPIWHLGTPSIGLSDPQVTA